MTIKVYTATICGSQEVRKLQQRVLFILSTLPLDLEIIDITEPGRENDREFMQEEVKKHDKKNLLPPQIFNNETYCGNYDDFQLAADDDIIMSFLKLEEPPSKNTITNGLTQNPTATQNGIAHTENGNHSNENEDATQETGEEIINTSNENNLGNTGNPGENAEDAPKPTEEVKGEEDENEEETSEEEEED